MDLDRPPNAMPATRSAVLAPAAAIVASATAKGRPPKPQMKKSTTKTTSRLAIEGAPAPTTPEASIDGGHRLLKSMGSVLISLTFYSY